MNKLILITVIESLAVTLAMMYFYYRLRSSRNADPRQKVRATNSPRNLKSTK